MLGLSAVAVVIAGARSVTSRAPPSQDIPRRPVAALRGASAMLALSVFADSGVEHLRGGYRNPGMAAPVAVAALVVAVNVAGVGGGGRRSAAADTLHATAVALGGAGLGFHAWNVLHRPGQLSWHNLFYAAPVGAPAALALAGLIGLGADQIRADDAGPTVAGLPAGRTLAALTAAGLAGTAAEVALLHFRGNFQSAYMWLPVTLPPVATLLLAADAARGKASGMTRLWMRLTLALGIAGIGFHARGVARMMGGWRNWSQNLVDGPPLPAPPAFSALALAGLGALSLLESADG